MSRTISDIICTLAKPVIAPLPSPPYQPPQHLSEESMVGGRVALAVSSMAQHTTDEGWQVMQGLEASGYTLAGHGLTTTSMMGTEYAQDRENMVGVPEILDFVRPHTLLLQDKREWDLARKDFRDPHARFRNYECLHNHPEVFKVTILKDSHQRPEYHRQSADEIGCHAWVIYYHPTIVSHLAPYTRPEHLIRTYHSLNSDLLPPLSAITPLSFSENREGCLLSGAVNANVYPLRQRLMQGVYQLYRTTLLPHPGYGRAKCYTPEFLKLLIRYKVAICTSSVYGYALRKIIEATAAGCVVVTDLPEDEVLPHINDNLYRVPVNSTPGEVGHLCRKLCNAYNPQRQYDFAVLAREFYDYRAVGKRLANDIEDLRQRYNGGEACQAPNLNPSTNKLVIPIAGPVEQTLLEKKTAALAVTSCAGDTDSSLMRQDKQESSSPQTLKSNLGKEWINSSQIEASSPIQNAKQEALKRMVPPSQKRPGKPRGGVIQIWVTRACDKACFGCTQGSNLGGNPGMMTVAQFEQACLSLKGYWGIVGMFGGNPCMHSKFPELCSILRRHFPKEQCGLWSNNPISRDNAQVARATFNPAVSNLNVHLDNSAYRLFKEGWPESNPFGLYQDSRHSPCYVALKDVLRKECPKCNGTGMVRHTSEVSNFGMEEIKIPEGATLTIDSPCPNCADNTWGKGSGTVYDEDKAWELISHCDINQHWSAMIGVFRGELRAWFCEIAGAQAMLHQHETDYPDTGINPEIMSTAGRLWWDFPMTCFAHQVEKHCHECSVPLRGYGELAQSASSDSKEQTSATHQSIFIPKKKERQVEMVTQLAQLGSTLARMTNYLQNSKV